MGLISILPEARKKFTTNFTPLAEYSPLSHYDITFLLMKYIRPICVSSYVSITGQRTMYLCVILCQVCCEIRSKRLDLRQVENHQKIKLHQKIELQLEQISIKTLFTENYQTCRNFFKCQAQYTLYRGSIIEFFKYWHNKKWKV